MNDDAAAEDATQETFVRVHRHLAQMPDETREGRRAIVAWVYRIATNYCLNEIRNRKTRPEPVETLPDQAGRDQREVFANADLAARLIARTPAKLNAPAWLHHVDGLDQGEVARVLGVSVRTVANRLAAFEERARKFVLRSA